MTQVSVHGLVKCCSASLGCKLHEGRGALSNLLPLCLQGQMQCLIHNENIPLMFVQRMNS